FAALAAYRLFQLRPELFTILATVALAGALLGDRFAATRRGLPGGALGFALWASAPGGFGLRPPPRRAAAPATAPPAPRAVPAPGGGRAAGPPRRGAAARGLGAAGIAAGLGSLATPIGLRAHALYFAAGSTTPDLAMIVDEWAPLRLFALPLANRPPSLASW